MAKKANKLKRGIRESRVDMDGIMSSYFNEFEKSKQADRLAPDTLKAYRKTFERFEEHFGEEAELAGDITPSLISEWKTAMADKDMSAATINHHISNIRVFFYWCMELEREYLPHFKINLVKRQEEPPKDYTKEEVYKLLKKPTHNDKFTDWRSWAIACFVIGTGARIGTIVEIQMNDINLKEGKVRYRHTKNKLHQVANMPPQLVKALRDYIAEWRQSAEETDYLFCTLSNEQLSRHSLRSAYSNFTSSRGVDKTSIHGLRHTFAREWYYNGGDVVQLSKILGHSTIAMSERYMRLHADKMQDTFNLYNPLENMTKGRGKATKTVKRSSKE